MDKMRMETADLTAANVEKIGALFPNCITETKDEDGKLKKAINFDLLRQMLSGEVVEGNEAYEFTWVGKKAAIVEANKPIRKTLRPCPEESVDWDSTENLYIEGDNLEVLKLLQESYLGKVKMIYIDPPYNTGHDFIYPDSFIMDNEAYNEGTGYFDEDGNVNYKRENNISAGKYHSDWCSMIYSRLMLARNLLSDDGVIFISIDDGEVGNLRKVCEDVFGAQNFVANVIWEKKYTVANDAKYFSDNHDHILCFTKNISNFDIGRLPRTEEMNAAYKNPDNHPKGIWKATPLHAKSGSANGADFSYTFKNGVTFTPPAGTYPRYSAETLKRFDDNNEIWFGKDGKSIPSRKTFLCDLKNAGIVPRTIIDYNAGGHNHEAVEEVKQLMNDNLFTNPKPVKLLKLLITIANANNDDIILDFFSGSATTAHAVMQLNAEDGGHRKFIMVQLPEETDEKSEASKAGYATIAEIGKERIRRAGAKIKSETGADIDTGFRVFKLDSSNMNDVYYSASDYTQDMLSMLESNVKSDRTDMDLLFGCLLDWGLPLSMPYKSETIDGYTVHTYNDGDLIACFDESISDTVIKEIAKRKPLRAVFRDSSFDGSPAKINVGEIFKMFAPDTRVKVI